ncbi:hypothetical protein E3O44_12115 [Cryobacterium algoricola]|uniref:Alpha/beta hydrolase n=1 Tax=Cryobacterium algoricola TaxID=1259183 RepID=A0ABY2IDW9_9MICO|nr:hypothetical protein [Cryobacterium algoricola]TFB86200.1 hypothetical protein E3O44_12115 [Cryobacterium algoricola]
MSTFVWSPSDLEDAPVAVLLPGVGYPVKGPILYWCGQMLAQSGWHVQAVEWTINDDARSDPQPFVEKAVAEAFDAAPSSSRRLVVAKSFGCFALPWARRNGIPGVWLTPVLTDAGVRTALAEAPVTDMAIGGTADALWLPASIAETRANVMSVPRANHSLAIPGDWRGSLTAQSAVFDGIASHLGLT